MHKLFSVISLFFLLLVSATVLADHSIPRILIVGDSLSAAYNIPVEQSWPELFSINIRSSYPHASVINASITGET
ncbi:MAG: arylesterase, partial [Gammaproteobacteria bacterium]